MKKIDVIGVERNCCVACQYFEFAERIPESRYHHPIRFDLQKETDADALEILKWCNVVI